MLAVLTTSTPVWWGAFNTIPSQHGPAGAISVGAGLYNDYVASTDTSLWVWGDDTFSQYGNNTQISNQPGTVRDAVDQASAYGAVMVVTGGDHVLLIRDDGTLWAWGDDTDGELGIGSASSTPTKVPVQIGLANIVQVAAGGGVVGEPYSMALASDGTVWVWGDNLEGQLGLGSINNTVLSPTQLTSLTGVVAIAASPDGVNSMALKSDGTVWTWGRNNLGNGSSGGSSVPVQVSGLTGVATIAVSYSHGIVAKSDGTVWDWGDNSFGELDNGTSGSTPVLTPIQANGVSGATEVAAGDFYSEVLLSNGTVWGWGENDHYELGLGITSNAHLSPVQALLPTTVAQSGPCPLVGIGTGPNPGPSAPEMLGGGPIDELGVAPNCCRGVTPAIGNFWDTTVDLAIPGRGVPISFARTYNSLLAAQNGPLGFGWTDSYNVYITFDGGGNPTIHEENGATIGFTLSGGQYVPPSRVLATLVKNGDGTFTLNRRFQVHLTFSATPNSQQQYSLLKVTDRNNYPTTLAYTGDLLTSVTDPAGRSLTLSYTNGLLTQIADNAGRAAHYGYTDGFGDLTSVTDLGGNLTQFSYDTSTHLLKIVTDPRTHQLINSYNPTTNTIATQTDPDGNETLFGYGINQTSITTPRGNAILEQYQNNAVIARTVGYLSAQAVTWAYSYDSATLGLTSVVEPIWNPAAGTWATATNTWFASGYVHTTADPLQHKTTFSYDGLNDVLTIQDALLVTTTNTYDGNGNLTQTSTPLVGTSQTQVVKYTYGDSSHPGDVTSVTDADLKVWTTTYDQYGDQISTGDPMTPSDVTTYCYDSVGRLKYKLAPLGVQPCNVLPNGFETGVLTNAFGDITSFNDPVNDHTTYVLDGNRNLTQVIDPRQNLDSTLGSTLLAYDNNNQVTSVTSASSSLPDVSSKVVTAYDPNGNVSSIQDGLGAAHTTHFEYYDALDHRRWATDPNSNRTYYGYDPLGHLTSVQSPTGPATTMGYDAAGRLTNIYYSAGGTPNVTFTYDSDNQRNTMADGSGTSTYTFDSLHRLTAVIDGSGRTVSYGYDLKSQLTSITYPGTTNKVIRTYDAAGRLKTVADWLGHATTYNYDADGNLSTEVYPNGITANYFPDQADRVKQITDTKGKTTFLNFQYGLDQDNDVCNIGGTSCSGGTMAPYDALDRQTIAQSTPTYSYDAAGNMKTITNSGTTTTLTFDNAEQASSLVQMNGGTVVRSLTYTFDGNGNRTKQVDQTGAATQYFYDQANRLVRYIQGTTNSTYAYNGDGLRTSKTVGGTSEPFVWNLVDPSAAPLLDGTTNYVAGFGGQPIEQITSRGTVYYYHQDQLGSTADTTDSHGNLVDQYTYDSYGNKTQTAGSIANPIQFASQYLDSESGLMYLRARYYEPGTGLFLTRDPFADGSSSPYSYGAGSPQNATDASGMGPDWQAGLNALTAGAKDIGRQVLVMALTGAMDWISSTRADLVSGDPLRVARGTLGCVLVAAMFIPGVGEAEAGVDSVEGATDITSILSEHVAAAEDRFAVEGFTEGQARALADNPGLERAFTGERIDTFAKESAAADPRLQGIQITGRFQRGADFIDPATGRWWDITTQRQWAAHVAKYGPNGTLLPWG